MKISIDVGYSSTKAISDNGVKVVFPSIVASVRGNPINGAGKFESQQHYVQFDNKEYYVGESAIRNITGLSTMNREKPAHIHDLYVLTAAYLCGAGSCFPMHAEPVNLAVGLPLAYYRLQKNELKKRLEDTSANIQINGGPKKYISFKDVSVFPQGLGALFCIPILSLPQWGYVGIIDIGCFTTDYMLISIENGEPIPIPDSCGSIEIGTYMVQQDVAASFLRYTGAPLAHFMVNDALHAAQDNRPLLFKEKKINLSSAYKKSVQETAILIMENIRSAWVSRADFLSLTAFAGGGAEMFEQYLSQFPKSLIIQEPVTANARGYLAMLAA